MIFSRLINAIWLTMLLEDKYKTLIWRNNCRYIIWHFLITKKYINTIQTLQTLQNIFNINIGLLSLSSWIVCGLALSACAETNSTTWYLCKPKWWKAGRPGRPRRSRPGLGRRRWKCARRQPSRAPVRYAISNGTAPTFSTPYGTPTSISEYITAVYMYMYVLYMYITTYLEQRPHLDVLDKLRPLKPIRQWNNKVLWNVNYQHNNLENLNIVFGFYKNFSKQH